MWSMGLVAALLWAWAPPTTAPPTTAPPITAESTAASSNPAPPATVPSPSAAAAEQAQTQTPPAPSPAVAAAPAGWLLPHWDKGFVLASSPEGGMPFRLVLNHVSQFKYTNSLATEPTYTDHFGNVHDVV